MTINAKIALINILRTLNTSLVITSLTPITVEINTMENGVVNLVPLLLDVR